VLPGPSLPGRVTGFDFMEYRPRDYNVLLKGCIDQYLNIAHLSKILCWFLRLHNVFFPLEKKYFQILTPCHLGLPTKYKYIINRNLIIFHLTNNRVLCIILNKIWNN